MSLFECYFLLSCKRSFYNHCYYSSQSGSYKLLFQPGWWRFSLCNNIKPRSFLSSPIIAMHSAAEHLAKGMILLYPPPPCFFYIFSVWENTCSTDCWQEEILKLIKYVEQTSGNESSFKIISIVADQACML